MKTDYNIVEIINWREFVEHFGIEKAKELSIQLTQKVNRSEARGIMVMAISYDLGFYATFSLSKIKNKKLFYEFTGTAG